MQRTAIHQPNFFPWLGYFDRIQKVDRFVFFDHVALPGGRTIVQRVKVLGPKEPVWLTFPIGKSGRHGQRICETKIRDPKGAYQAVVDKLSAYYRRAPHFHEVSQLLEELVPRGDSLSAFNGMVIEAISKRLELGTEFVYSSSSPKLMASDAIKTEMIVQTCEAFGAKDYVSGRGCLDFLDTAAFAERGIALQFQDFEHPVYGQGDREFVAGLSILDALFYLGFEGTREVLLSSSLALSS